MLLFQPIKTRRVCVRLKELEVGQGIALCKLPADRNELLTSEFLRFVAADAQAPASGYVTDPRLWTVQERARMVCHYLAQVADDGPDFAVGEAKLTDYMDFTADLQAETVKIDGWTFGHLLGYHAELLERSCENRGDWLIGAMACQALRDGEADVMADMTDIEQLTELSRRIDAIKALPESEFEELVAAYDYACAHELRHFLDVGFDDGGVLFDAKGGAGLAPARFRADSCISPVTRSLFGSPAGSGR